MFTGNLYDEAAPLRVALAYERATKWRTMHPNLEKLA
jgi:Asp-tRNA(Asn)/Glu-tRNA(Gln) amidotransferase A subunit family amidase